MGDCQPRGVPGVASDPILTWEAESGHGLCAENRGSPSLTRTMGHASLRTFSRLQQPATIAYCLNLAQSGPNFKGFQRIKLNPAGLATFSVQTETQPCGF